MALGAVRKAKERHPEVTLTLLLSYYPFPEDTSDYDRTYYPEGIELVPKPYVIARANEHMWYFMPKRFHGLDGSRLLQDFSYHVVSNCSIVT